MIKLIIFDAYGVILSGGYQYTCRNIGKKFKLDHHYLYEIIYKKYFNQAAERKITQNEAWEKAIKELHLPISVQEIKKIHYGLMGLNMKVIDFIKTLDKNYNTLLLSKNTRSQLHDAEKLLGFKKYFKNVINTWELRLPKASRKTILYLEKRFKVKPSEIVYIDDQQENLVEAKKMKINTILYKSFNQFKKELRSYLK